MRYRITSLLALVLTSTPVAAQFPLDTFLKSSNPGQGDMFGSAIAIDGDTLVVGAPFENSGTPGVNPQPAGLLHASGAAYIFVRTGDVWTQEAFLKASNASGFDEFGCAVAVDGDTVAVGACGENAPNSGNNAGNGAVYVFVRAGGVWSQQALLRSNDPDNGDEFGESVSLEGDVLIVGASGEDSSATGVGGDELDDTVANSGAVFVFERTGTSWTQSAYLKASNGEVNDRFGARISLSGDTIVVGAAGEDSSVGGTNGDPSDNGAPDSGASYVFTRSGMTWVQDAYLKSSALDDFDRFGSDVDVFGDTLIVAAEDEDSLDGLHADVGAVYVFRRSGSGWMQEAYLRGNNSGAEDRFGTSARIFGDTIVVGARGEDSQPLIGFSNNDLERAGAAYAFTRTGTAWDQLAFLKAPNGTSNDRFGWAADVSGDTVVSGAPFEGSGGFGVNGDQSLGNVFDFGLSGAAYVFDLAPTGPSSTIVESCNGDGGNQAGCTDCPCGNNAPTGTIGGCLNSAGTSARLEAARSTSISSGYLRFEAYGVPAFVNASLISGNTIAPANPQNPCFGQSAGLRAAFLDGLRCSAQNVLRHGVRPGDANGLIGETTNGWGEPNAFAGYGAFFAGGTKHFQLLYRDDPALVCARGLNSSQAVSVTFGL